MLSTAERKQNRAGIASTAERKNSQNELRFIDMNRLKELKEEARSVEKLEYVYVEFLENIKYISDIDLEDSQAFSSKMYEMAITEKTRRLYERKNEI